MGTRGRIEMKRLLVAVLVLAGCASKAPQERPLPPGMVTVATFTAEADPVARTFTIRTQPTAAGRAQGMAALAVDRRAGGERRAHPGSISVRTTHGCPVGDAHLGGQREGDVAPGRRHLAGRRLRGDHQLLGAGGQRGMQQRRGAGRAERGIRALGLPHDRDPIAAGPQTVTWAFGRVSGAAVTFSGRIVAAKVGVTADVLDLALEGDQVIAGQRDWHGRIRRASSTALQFVNFDGTGGRSLTHRRAMQHRLLRTWMKA